MCHFQHICVSVFVTESILLLHGIKYVNNSTCYIKNINADCWQQFEQQKMIHQGTTKFYSFLMFLMILLY